MGKNKYLEIEGATIIYRNFEGRRGPYNKEGDRSFAVVFDDLEFAQQLADEGWNIKFPNQDPESEFTKHPFLKVAVRFSPFPCKLFLVTDTSQVRLNEHTAEQLDRIETSNVDLIIRGYQYDINGREGIKAYLDTGYFVMDSNNQKNRFQSKYAHLLGGHDDDELQLPFK